MSKRRHNFGTNRFKEKSLFIFHARIALKSLILLFVRLIARGAKTHRQNKYCNPRACAPRVNNIGAAGTKIVWGGENNEIFHLSCKLKYAEALLRQEVVISSKKWGLCPPSQKVCGGAALPPLPPFSYPSE